jgi:hypothetical protein
MVFWVSIRKSFRKWRASNRAVVRIPVQAATGVYRAVAAPFKFCFSGAYRSSLLLELSRPGELHQSTALTALDRYPDIFAASLEFAGDRAELKILSYGCSTGEEVLTLRRYFPAAVIVGAEINPRSLTIARSRKTDERMMFLESEPAAIGALGPFDIIFCLAVLQRTPGRVAENRILTLKNIYPFEKFDEKIGQLNSWLKTGGLFVIHHTQYLFTDSAVAAKYAPLVSGKPVYDTDPKFGRDSWRRFDISFVNSLFVKVKD